MSYQAIILDEVNRQADKNIALQIRAAGERTYIHAIEYRHRINTHRTVFGPPSVVDAEIVKTSEIVLFLPRLLQEYQKRVDDFLFDCSVS